MITIVIPTLNAAATLPATLSALMPATIEGLVKQVIISDGGSTDETAAIADACGADLLLGKKGRGAQLAAGAAAARGEWLLFLHADTKLSDGWERDAAALIAAGKESTGYFQFQFDANNWKAGIVEFGVRLRCFFFGLPYGDQGLLISRAFYDQLGGYGDMPLFEDVDMVQRVKKQGRLVKMNARAVTSASRYEHDGYAPRVLKNLRCLFAYLRGVPPVKILEFYR